MCVHEACDMARAAVVDSTESSDLKLLASFGAYGRHPANEMRDYRR